MFAASALGSIPYSPGGPVYYCTVLQGFILLLFFCLFIIGFALSPRLAHVSTCTFPRIVSFFRYFFPCPHHVNQNCQHLNRPMFPFLVSIPIRSGSYFFFLSLLILDAAAIEGIG